MKIKYVNLNWYRKRQLKKLAKKMKPALDEAMTALRGIKQYQKDIQAERDIRAGHLRFED